MKPCYTKKDGSLTIHVEGAESGFVDMPLLLRMKVYSPQQTHDDMLFHKNCQSTIFFKSVLGNFCR